jgi:hypothetical protein
MFVVVCPDPSLRAELRLALLEPHEEVLLAHDWDAISRADRLRAHACVYACRSFFKDARERVLDVQRCSPALPLVVATSWHPDNSKRLAPVRLDGVVWLEDAKRTLLRSVREVSVSVGGLQRLASILGKDSCGHDARVRGLLVEVCRSAPPIPSVGGLANAACLCESKLRSRIAAFFNGRPRAPSRFLGWVLLLAAHDLGRRGLTQSRISFALGVELSTLRRSVRCTVDCCLSEFLQLHTRDLVRSAVRDLRIAPALEESQET